MNLLVGRKVDSAASPRSPSLTLHVISSKTRKLESKVNYKWK
jgi:hypothetical protein